MTGKVWEYLANYMKSTTLIY